MLTTDDLTSNEYIFQSSPESCSDRSYSTDFMDVTSDEDFLTQLSLDLDIPLYLNPGEDELNLLNSHFDKSPDEILSDVASPPYNMEDDYTKEDNELKNIDFTVYDLTSIPNHIPSIKLEKQKSSDSEKSISPIQSDLQIKEEVQIKTPPLSPNYTTTVKDIPNTIIYTQPLQILTTSHNVNTVSSKQIPIVPKTQISLPISTPQSTKVIVVENVNLKKSVPQIKVEPITAVTTSVNVVPSVMLNAVNRFSASSTIDPRLLKKQQRKIKNRESASLSRKRKKDYMTSLEEQVKELSTENKRLQVENVQLKQKLAVYEGQQMNQTKKRSVKPSIFLCMVLLVIGVNLDLIRNPLASRNQFSIMKNDVPKINDHFGRNLLWADEKESNNNTLNFSPFTMCPAAINQTESARLVLELERWIGKPKVASTKIEVNENATTPTVKRKKLNLNDGPFTAVYRKHRSRNSHQENLNSPKTAIQVFSVRPENIYTEFFEAINRQEDTYYVVSFTDQHMLLPALNHNKTRRPKMSLIMPSMLLNDSLSQGSMVPLMQIDCEVLDTRLIHIRHGLIPQHLRAYANVTKEKPSHQNSNLSNADVPKYYKKSYKPYFINKNGVKTRRDFFNIPFN